MNIALEALSNVNRYVHNNTNIANTKGFNMVVSKTTHSYHEARVICDP